MPVIHWFRRDLRLTDNTAFNHAVLSSGGEVLPVFILDEGLLRGKDMAPARVQFMLDCLRDLDNSLKQRGCGLIVRRGDSDTELLKLAREARASAAYFNRDYTPAARKRDQRVTDSLQAAGVKVESFKDLVIFEEDDLLTGAGKPYTVFAPYKKAWLARPKPAATEPADQTLRSIPSGIQGSPLPSAHDLGFNVTQDVPPGGESRALAMLQDFAASERIANYAAQRDIPSQDGTSRLSPHLRFGTVSPRVCLQAAEAARKAMPAAQQDGADVWISELIWREFYMQVLYHFPHANHGNFKREYDALRWGNGSKARDDELFAAWREGRTGYPIVDAAMRQLNQTAWMHNRTRMIVASFLTKDLLLDWRLGENYFMQMLVDGDPAANNGGWQWAASTGTDAQPYFRVFNPRLQSERFDPEGKYIRRWVPELAHVPNDYIHEPSAMPPMIQTQTKCIIGQDYPAPIVNHAEQKAEILRRFKAIK
jgi:deoxyribodipyrimidine photo-lyase